MAVTRSRIYTKALRPHIRRVSFLSFLFRVGFGSVSIACSLCKIREWHLSMRANHLNQKYITAIASSIGHIAFVGGFYFLFNLRFSFVYSMTFDWNSIHVFLRIFFGLFFPRFFRFVLSFTRLTFNWFVCFFVPSSAFANIRVARLCRVIG